MLRAWQKWAVATLLAVALAGGIGASSCVSRRARAGEPRALPPAGDESIEVSYPSADGAAFAGTLMVPPGSGPHPAVLLLSGSGPQDRDGTHPGHKPFRVLAERLVRAGFVVLRVDDRGAGATTASPTDATIQTHATDARAGLAFLRARSEVDGSRVGLLGHSEGSLIAALVASELDVAFVVSLAGPGLAGRELSPLMVRSVLAATGDYPLATVEQLVAAQRAVVAVIANDGDDDAVRSAVRAGLDVQDALSPPSQRVSVSELDARAVRSGRIVSTPWFRSYVKTDPRLAWRRVRCPVLALNGDRDPLVEPGPNLSQIGAALADNPDVTLRVLPGLNHMFQPARTGLAEEYATIDVSFDQQALELITDWLVVRAGE